MQQQRSRSRVSQRVRAGRRSALLCLLVAATGFVCLLAFGVRQAAAQQAEQDQLSPEEKRLRDGLRKAKPAPMRSAPERSPDPAPDPAPNPESRAAPEPSYPEARPGPRIAEEGKAASKPQPVRLGQKETRHPAPRRKPARQQPDPIDPAKKP